jgi:preprotein translocase SecF subunit
VFDIVGKRKWFYAISLAVTIPGLLFILLTLVPNGGLGLRFSIAYRGGTEWTVHFANGAPDPLEVVKVLEQAGLPGAEVVTTTSNNTQNTLIRTAALSLSAGGGVSNGASPAPTASEAPATSAPTTGTSAPTSATSPAPASAAPSQAAASPGASAALIAPGASPATGTGAGFIVEGKLGEVRPALEAAFGPIDKQLELTSVGPVVSAELIQQTFLLILMGAVGIMLWITYRFRDFRMGAVALVALLHDVIVVVGIFAIMGTFLALQIDALFVTAMLTVIGFSVHDTIVVFDRVRENRVRHSGEPFDAIVNHSILQTAGRSINTSLTVVFTLLALFLFGGAAIHSFVLALLIGIVSGTYSSVFNASPLLVDWHLWDERRRRAALASQVKPHARTA